MSSCCDSDLFQSPVYIVCSVLGSVSISKRVLKNGMSLLFGEVQFCEISRHNVGGYNVIVSDGA